MARCHKESFGNGSHDMWSNWRRNCVVSAALVAALIGPAAVALVGALDGRRAPSGTHALVFPPSMTRAEQVAIATAAGADLIGPGGIAPVLVVRLSTPEQFSALRASGAMLVLSVDALSGCFTDKRPQSLAQSLVQSSVQSPPLSLPMSTQDQPHSESLL